MDSLDILIPTYNRASFLLSNLEKLRDIINQVSEVEIGIIVSDNASTDSTVDLVNSFISKNKTLKITLHTQPINEGYSKNLIKLVSYSQADYIMTLGDDDYVDIQYIHGAIQSIQRDSEITCILPSFQAISENGQLLGFGRDLGKRPKLYEPGIDSIKENCARAHQISGIILKRSGLDKALHIHKITNLYPQIYMAGWACIQGKCLHLPQWPILVTQTDKKDWRYDEVGLLNDIFQNYSSLPINAYHQYLAEKEILSTQKWRALRFWNSPIKQIKVIGKISFGKNTSIPGHLLHPFLLTFYWLHFSFSAVKNKIIHSCQSGES